MRQENQRYGRNKSTVVDHAYLDSGEYRRKFDNISDSPQLNKLLYRLSKKMLLHRSGTVFEDMYWIAPDTCQIVAKEVSGDTPHAIHYSKNTKKAILKHSNLIAIHSHPMSGPPSAADFNSIYKNKYKIGIVCCHDGRVFLYHSKQYISSLYYSLRVDIYVRKGYTTSDAEIKVLEELQERHSLMFKEVLS